MSEKDPDEGYYTAMLKVANLPEICRAPSYRDIGAISDKDFVVAWQRSDTLVQVARTLGVKITSAVNRAAALRIEGVSLKKI